MMFFWVICKVSVGTLIQNGKFVSTNFHFNFGTLHAKNLFCAINKIKCAITNLVTEPNKNLMCAKKKKICAIYFRKRCRVYIIW